MGYIYIYMYIYLISPPIYMYIYIDNEADETIVVILDGKSEHVAHASRKICSS